MVVSIIISNYNYSSYLAQAIDSALNQTNPVEVIVIDDGSTDNSKDIITSYGDRIRSVLKQNEGQYSCFNLGWKLAKGEMIMFLDSDDVLLPDAAKKCAERLKEPGVIKAQFLLKKVDKYLQPIGGTAPAYGLGDEANIKRDIALWGYYLSPPNSGNAYTKDFLDKIMPMQRLTFGGQSYYYLPADDYAKSLAGLAGRIVNINEVLGLYRFHGENESDSGKVETLKKLRILFMYDYIRERHQMEWAPKFGVPCKFDFSRFHPTVCKKRFLAYRLQPEDHPIPEDNYFRLLFSGLWGAVRFPYLKLNKRIFIICGFIAIGVLPRPMLRKMLGAVAKPEERKGVLRLFRFGT